jgi:hypothetical protein
MAANHTKLLGLGVGAILAISPALTYARAKQPSDDTLRAEARNFFKIVGGDKRKSQTYCKIVKLNDQIDEKEDPIDARKLTRERNKLEKKLGRKYVAFVSGLVHLEKDSRVYKEITLVLERLDKGCEHHSQVRK